MRRRTASGLRLVDLASAGDRTALTCARLLVDRLPEGWPSLPSALREVRAMTRRGRLARVALVRGRVAGWIGGLPMYPGNVWELHPLVVGRAFEGRGVGRALVADLEARVRERGAHSLLAGSDDERGQTSLAGVELYPDVLGHLARLRNLRRHPVGFYRKLGFTVVGAMPHANGWGRPDIFLAKRVAPIGPPSVRPHR